MTIGKHKMTATRDRTGAELALVAREAADFIEPSAHWVDGTLRRWKDRDARAKNRER